MSTKQKRKYVKRGTALLRDLRVAELAVGKPLMLRMMQLERENLLLRAALIIVQSKVKNMSKATKSASSFRLGTLTRKAA